MAKFVELDQDEWGKWLQERPPEIREMCRKFPPNLLYRMEETGHRVTIHSYSEDGTVTVNVDGDFNSVMFDRQVFGVSPESLKECDLPGDQERVGTVLTNKDDVEAYVEAVARAEGLRG